VKNCRSCFRFKLRLRTVKQTLVLGTAIPVFGVKLGETGTGVICILVIFQDIPMFSNINGKLSPRPFQNCG